MKNRLLSVDGESLALSKDLKKQLSKGLGGKK